MSSIVLYIATSLDGFIARPNGELDWLTSVPKPETGDYGYSELLDSIGTIIMGRKTCEEILGFGIDWPYMDKKTYIVSKNLDFKISTPETYIPADDLHTFVTHLKNTEKKTFGL